MWADSVIVFSRPSVCVWLSSAVIVYHSWQRLTDREALHLGTAFSAILNESSWVPKHCWDAIHSSKAAEQLTYLTRPAWVPNESRRTHAHTHINKALLTHTHTHAHIQSNVGGKFIPKHRCEADWNNPRFSLALFCSTLWQWNLSTIENISTSKHTYTHTLLLWACLLRSVLAG